MRPRNWVQQIITFALGEHDPGSAQDGRTSNDFFTPGCIVANMSSVTHAKGILNPLHLFQNSKHFQEKSKKNQYKIQEKKIQKKVGRKPKILYSKEEPVWLNLFPAVGH